MTTDPQTTRCRATASPSNTALFVGRRRLGVTLLEVLAASTVMAAALVPALRLMADSLEQSRDMETREALATLSMSILEFDAGQTAGNWDLRDRTRTELSRTVGVANLVVQTRRSDVSADGGIPNKLAVIEVVAWQDTNQNRVVDGQEMSVRFVTKVARVVSYGYEARNS